MIVLASDHSGLHLKNQLKEYLEDIKIETYDIGPFEYDRNDDYPDYINIACEEIVKSKSYGIFCCASGIGVSMCANKKKDIRAVNAVLKEHSYYARLHEDANVLCFGQNYITFETAKECIDLFLKTEFEGGRHLRRISKY